MSRRVLLITGCCLIVLLHFQCAEQPDKASGTRRSKEATRMLPEDLERRSLELNALQAETEALYRSLKAKETLLFDKQAELDSIRTALEMKELELLQREKAARSTRNTGVVFLIAGLALIFFALRKMAHGKSTRPTVKAAVAPAKPEAIKSAKAPQKDEA